MDIPLLEVRRSPMLWLFQRLDDLVLELNERGVQVFFWHVPRAYNTGSDDLANFALDNK